VMTGDAGHHLEQIQGTCAWIYQEIDGGGFCSVEAYIDACAREIYSDSVLTKQGCWSTYT
jgi:hypothetical protein